MVNQYTKIDRTNSFAAKFPKLAKEWDHSKNEKNPQEFTTKSLTKVWWICPEKHSYIARISHRTDSGSGCPYCANRKTGYGNDLKTMYPKLAKEWDHSKNKLKPNEVRPGSPAKYWWLCSKKHSYQTSLYKRISRNDGCPYCGGSKVGYGNDLKTMYPKLAKEWDHSKNKLKPNEVRVSSHKKVWWICSKGHSYDSQISSRTSMKTGCPYCSNKKIGYGNDLKTMYPKLAKEWDHSKNKLKPNEVFPGTHKKVWWKCKVGHNYNSLIYQRALEGTGCPYCLITPRSREEVYLLFELKNFFDVDALDRKIQLKKLLDVDIKIPSEKIVIEYDGAYWHKDKINQDLKKTKLLQEAGWTVIRVREKPLKILSRKYNVSSMTGDYKKTANSVLLKLNSLGYKTVGLNKYINRKTLVNKKEADEFIADLIERRYK